MRNNTGFYYLLGYLALSIVLGIILGAINNTYVHSTLGHVLVFLGGIAFLTVVFWAPGGVASRMHKR